jgi:ornithine carbamoyltransferase
MTHLLAGEPLPEGERCALLQTARRLRLATREGRDELPLRGRHVAIACDAVAPACDQSGLLEDAARRLGARVSHIRLDALGGTGDHAALARVLGSLYDAVDCCTLAPARALELQRLAGVPVFDGLAGSGHRVRALLPALRDGGDSPVDAAPGADITCLLQAVLLEAMA